MSDDRLDGGAAAQLTLDYSEDAALLAGDEDAAGFCASWSRCRLVDIGRSIAQPVNVSVRSMTSRQGAAE
jgi:hypothetical protein